MPYFPIPDPDVGGDTEDYDHHFSQEYLNLLNDLRLHLKNDTGGENEEVIRQIRSFMDEAFSKVGSSTIGDRLNYAQKLAKDAREKNSADENLRNAERYLYGLTALLNRDIANITGITGAPVYESLKMLAHALKDKGITAVERAMRTDENPTSKPSLDSIMWAYRGLKSALFITGQKNFDGPPHRLPEQSKSQKSGLRDVPDLQFRKP